MGSDLDKDTAAVAVEEVYKALRKEIDTDCIRNRIGKGCRV